MDAATGRQRLLTRGGLVLGGLVIGIALGILLAPGGSGAVDPAPPSVVVEPTQAPTGPEPTATPSPEEGARTPEGAVAAALEWMRRFTPALYLDDDARRAAVAEVAASSAEAELQRLTANVADNFRENGITRAALDDAVFLGLPAGYRIVSYTEDEAEVAIWLSQVAHVQEHLPLRVTWDTQTTVMRWEEGRWRLVSVSSVDGPTPELSQQGDGQLITTLQAIEEFTEFSHGP